METARNHLLITPDLAVKGTISRVAGRLSDHLGHFERPMLTVENAEITFFTTFERAETMTMDIAFDHILFAHEYVAMSGDPHLQAMNRGPVPDRYRIVMAGMAELALTARLKNAPTQWKRRFVVVTEPETEDVGGCPPGLTDAIDGLPYLLANRDRVETYFRA